MVIYCLQIPKPNGTVRNVFFRPLQNTTHSNVYLGEWYQKEADLNRQLMVSFFPSDNSVELVDMKTRKTFLRRTKIDDLCENDFFIGAKLLIFGKQIDIVDYGDAKTRNKKANEQL
ncbi:AGAP003227-PA-like protein [Anopheles sinensis]|uniref:AGAP003227-PA-like protein n=1 Tax=Anopheles sinensis TaxID=74873 RepID=A0A084WSM9_ANOSI|nr:AGAP003227-PA-like protein [Anopheles sinensis]